MHIDSITYCDIVKLPICTRAVKPEITTDDFN